MPYFKLVIFVAIYICGNKKKYSASLPVLFFIICLIASSTATEGFLFSIIAQGMPFINTTISIRIFFLSIILYSVVTWYILFSTFSQSIIFILPSVFLPSTNSWALSAIVSILYIFNEALSLPLSKFVFCISYILFNILLSETLSSFIFRIAWKVISSNRYL